MPTIAIAGRAVLTNSPAGTPTTAVICLHGWGGSGSSFFTTLGYNPTDKHVAYPDATLYPRTWNPDDVPQTLVDDCAFIDAIRAYYAALGVTKFYLVGHSQGAMMAYRYLAKNPGSIDGVIAISGYYSQLSEAAATIGKPILHIHGLDDTIVPVEGGARTLEGNGDYFTAKACVVGTVAVPGAGHDIPSINTALSPDSIIEQIEDFIA